ncbi:hypothetical protein LINGRAHAP2_LOCUS8855 [Linum grandiflorum]
MGLSSSTWPITGYLAGGHQGRGRGYAELIRLSEHTLWSWQCHWRSWPPRLLVLEQPTLWCVKRS